MIGAGTGGTVSSIVITDDPHTTPKRGRLDASDHKRPAKGQNETVWSLVITNDPDTTPNKTVWTLVITNDPL